ncbi:MAG: hypothetical protein C4523_07220 [Myxococcales bacterium]|nr:MAG: hypothetical protein C4523_07220 [Myxococcales bacterium]
MDAIAVHAFEILRAILRQRAGSGGFALAVVADLTDGAAGVAGAELRRLTLAGDADFAGGAIALRHAGGGSAVFRTGDGYND